MRPSEMAKTIPSRTRDSFAHIEEFASTPPLLQAKVLKAFENMAEISDGDVMRFLSISAGPTYKGTSGHKHKQSSGDSLRQPELMPPPAMTAASAPSHTQPSASIA